MSYRFGDFVLDLERRELRRGTTPIRLFPKAFSLLEVLVKAAPKAVRKESLYRELWGDIFVDETNIANLISELRAALGDDSRQPRFIKTLHRVGYRFEGEVRADGAAEGGISHTGSSWLVWVSREFPLRPGDNVIGRDSTAQVWLDSAKVSRRHALIRLSDRAVLEDLGSKNGTFVQGERISRSIELKDGDTISLGTVHLTFRTLQDAETTLTEAKALP